MAKINRRVKEQLTRLVQALREAARSPSEETMSKVMELAKEMQEETKATKGEE